MPTTLIEMPAPPAVFVPRRKRWTRDECLELEAKGLLVGQHLELIDGELIDRMGKNRPHVICTALLRNLLIQLFGATVVQQESPIDVAPHDNPTNEPEPDLVVLKEGPGAYLKSNPRPSDIRLVVEISDSTLGFDLTAKARLYARAEIVEYWVLDVAGRRLLVHRDPQSGQYGSVVAYGEQESVIPLSATASLNIRDAFAD